MSSQVTLRPATIADKETLRQLAEDTFCETFAPYNTAEDMDKYVKEAFTPESIAKQLENPNSSFFLAEMDGNLVGYAKLNFGDAQSESVDPKAMEVERIYVRKQYLRNRIGKTLLDKAMEIATEKAVAMVWLGVWEKNERALGFYRANGFEKFDEHQFVLGQDVQTDWMMKKSL